MGRRDTLTVGELRSMLNGVDDNLEVYIQKVVTPLGAHGYTDAHGAEVALGIENDEGVNFPDPEDVDDSHPGTKNYFLVFP